MTMTMTITIYHNPSCGTSRNTLAMIRQSGAKPEIIEYLKTPPTRATLVDLMQRMGIGPRELLRQKGTPYAELDLGNPKWTDDQLVDFMMAHPILINRLTPSMTTTIGLRACRVGAISVSGSQMYSLTVAPVPSSSAI